MIEVFRTSRADPDVIFGPLPGIRDGDVVAYEFELPERFEPWPGRTRLERTFVLLDLGVSFSNPPWVRETRPDGRVADRSDEGDDCWYVDLITVDEREGRYTFTDLYIDVMIPTDGRHHRMLDLDEFAEAMESGLVPLAEASDALVRWQRFQDRHLHGTHAPTGTWADFPPRSIGPVAVRPGPLGPPVRWEG